MVSAKYIKHTLYFKKPAGTSRGILTQKDIFYLILKDSETKKTGIGEIAPIPDLSPETIPTLEIKIQNLVKQINSEQTLEFNNLSGFPSLRFGLETAKIGLNSDSPFHLFNTEFSNGKSGIPINGLIWMGKKEDMLAQLKEKLQSGFNCIKLKIGAIDFNDELTLLQSIRKHFPADQVEIRVDANGAFSIKEAFKKLELLSEYKIHSIEQPIKAGQFEEMEKLCRNTPLPVALDEELIGITEPEKIKEMLEFIRPQYIILKPTLTGGFEASQEWIKLAEKNRIGWWVTSALESNIGLNAIAQWTASLNTKQHQGLGTGGLFTNNINSPLLVKNGFLYYDSEKNWDFDF